MKKNTSRLLLVLFFILNCGLITLGFFSSATYALASTTLQGPSLTLFPSVNTLSVKKKNSYVQQITLINNATISSTLSVSAANFFNANDSGAISFSKSLSENSENPAQWFQVPPTLLPFAGHQKVTVPITIVIPDGIMSGGYYVAVFFQQNPLPTAQASSTLFPRVGTLFFLTVDGNTFVNLSITKEVTSSTLLSSLPFHDNSMTFDTYIKNGGDVHTQAKGTIIISDYFHHKITSLPVASHILLPGSTRKVTTIWNNPTLVWFGMYRVQTTITYLNKKSTYEAVYYAFPIYLLLFEICSTLGIIILGYFMIRKLMKVFNVSDYSNITVSKVPRER